MICNKCNAENPDNNLYCSCCGAQLFETITLGTQGNEADEQYAKVWSVICYFSIFGWIISLAAGNKNNSFIRTHQNNGLVCIIFAAGGTVLMCIPIVGWIIGCIAIIWAFVDTIFGIVWCLQGKKEEVPAIGKIHILK